MIIYAAVDFNINIANRLLADTDIPAQWCSTEQMESLAHTALDAGADHHQTHQLAYAMSHSPTLLSLPRAIIPELALDTITHAAQQAGIPPAIIDVARSGVDTGTAAEYKEQPTYRPQFIRSYQAHTQPQNPSIALTCDCQNCTSHTQIQHGTTETKRLYLRHIAIAQALEDDFDQYHAIAEHGDKIINLAIATHIDEYTSILNHFLALNQLQPNHPYHDNHHRINEIAMMAQYMADYELTNPETPQSIGELAKGDQERLVSTRGILDSHTALLTARQHANALSKPGNDTDTIAHHTTEIGDMLFLIRIIAKNLDLPAPQHPITEITQEVLDAEQEATDLHQLHTARLLNSLPTHVSQAAADHPDLLDLAAEPTGETACAYYRHLLDDKRNLASPIMTRFIHNQAVYYQLAGEPYPADYLNNRRLDDATQLARHYGVTNTAHTAPVTKLLSDLIVDARAPDPRLPQGSWESILAAIGTTATPPGAATSILSDLAGTTTIEQLLHENPKLRLPETPDDVAFPILAKAAELNMDQHQTNRIARGLRRPDLVTLPPPLHRRHIRAITRAATQIGLSPRAIYNITQVLQSKIA